jgi:hypothetical protein
MQATVYLFDDLTWRKRARWSRPADPGNVDQFVCQLERLLKRLGDLHLRISLARLPLAENGSETEHAGQAIVDNLQDPCALVGMMPDGSVVAAFLGPRGGDGVGDDEMTDRIRRRFERARRLAKTERMPGSLTDLTVAHCWSDEIFDVPSLVLDHASMGHEVVEFGDNDRSAGRQPA